MILTITISSSKVGNDYNAAKEVKQTDDELLVRVPAHRNTHGTLEHPAGAEVGLVCVDEAQVLRRQQVPLVNESYSKFEF